MREFINIVTEDLEPMLYHGTSHEALATILEEGVQAPSYWGTREEASRYAEGGVMLAVPVSRFDEDGLMVNDLMLASMREEGDEIDEPADWQESLEVFGSVRYDYPLMVSEGDVDA